MTKIDWVEIPGGEFSMGLSEGQIADIIPLCGKRELVKIYWLG